MIRSPMRSTSSLLVAALVITLAGVRAKAVAAQVFVPDTSTRARRASVVAAWDTVRLYVGDVPAIRGVVTRVDTAGLWVSPSVGQDSIYYAFTGISSGEVRRGSRGRGPGPFIKGTLIGLGIGSAVIVSAVKSSEHERGVTIGFAILLTAATTFVGAVGGVIVATAPEDVWAPFDLLTLRVALPQTASADDSGDAPPPERPLGSGRQMNAGLRWGASHP